MAVRHLIEHGHRKIACVGYDHTVYTVRERIEGYTNTMNGAGLTANVLPELPMFGDIYEWIAKIGKTKDRPTAIFSLNHRTSADLVRALAMTKLVIPEDIALIGFDDFDLAGVLPSPLTVITQSPEELARRAASLLFEQIQEEQKAVRIPAKVFLPVELKIRASCGCKQ